MSKTADVRDVRCPKCENLLPEVTNRCSGCGAVLRAKNKGVDLDTFSEKSDEESNSGNIHVLSDRYEKIMNVPDGRMNYGYNSDARSTISSSCRAERRVLRERAEISRTVLNKQENWDIEIDVMRDRRSNKIEVEKMNQDFEDLMTYRDNESGLRRPGRGRVGEKGDGSLYHESSYDFEDPAWNRTGVDGDDRAELLRQLDELKYKLSQSDNLYEKVHLDRRAYENHVTMQNSYNRPPLQDHYAEPPPLMCRQEMGEVGFYHVQGYGNPSRFQMPPARTYTSGPIMAYMDKMETYPPNVSRYHPSNRQFSAYIGKYSNVSDDVVSDLDYNHRITSQSHARWLPSDVSSEVDGFISHQPFRPHLGGGGGVRHCCPIAGGAPFLTCNSCSGLLLLPKKVLNKDGTTKKLRCGACSFVIAFVVSSKSLVVVDAKIKAGQTRTTSSSHSYDNSDYDFHSIDRDGRDDKTRNRHSTSTHEEETVAVADHAPPAGSSLQDYFEYSNKFHMAKDSGLGNRCEQDMERMLPKKTPAAKQFLRKDSAATEIDVSSNEFFNTGSTFESGEGTRGSRRGGSFIAGTMGSLNESHRSEEETAKQENGSVTVNGHLISDRLIKKAEKLAGPIQPGHYWYDFRAGFWGAMGGPCLGIIPPFIEEFNYPMQEDCSGGNTHVVVNGRELNHKDLDLLGSRGLPRERDRSYIVEISGRILDDETGEELESLGKLAPTMERAKRGFGMRVPQAVA